MLSRVLEGPWEYLEPLMGKIMVSTLVELYHYVAVFLHIWLWKQQKPLRHLLERERERDMMVVDSCIAANLTANRYTSVKLPLSVFCVSEHFFSHGSVILITGEAIFIWLCWGLAHEVSLCEKSNCQYSLASHPAITS